MKPAYIFPIGLVVVLLTIGGVFLLKNKTTETPAVSVPTAQEATTPVATSTTTTATTKTPGTYTLTEVATHSGMKSCWTVIAGTVYDLTSWIARHPGGEGAILSICGKDGTAAFEGQHGGQNRPEQILATFKIGILGS